MAWPELNRVSCQGFNRKILPIIAKAIDAEQVEWIKESCSMFAESFGGDFRYAGCIWHMEEFNEWVQSITLKEGTITDLDLTIAVLRG